MAHLKEFIVQNHDKLKGGGGVPCQCMNPALIMEFTLYVCVIEARMHCKLKNHAFQLLNNYAKLCPVVNAGLLRILILYLLCYRYHAS